MSDNNDTILVHTVDAEIHRGPRGGVKEINVQALGNNVNIFLAQIESILEKSPEDVGKFKLTKFSVTAEVTATGALMILGSGGEASAKGALTFEFERK